MRKILLLFLTLAVLFVFAACSTNQANVSEQSQPQYQPQYQNITIKESPDKYTWYIKNYVGRNCATIGYTSLGGSRLDRYGEGLLKLIFVSPDGTYVDYSSDDTLKDWVVTGQSLVPNTELKLVFEKDSDGNEYSSLVESQSYYEIVLSVKRINDNETKVKNLTTINPSPNKYTLYISDYVGRNLASFGYTSLGGDRLDTYGEGLLRFVFVSTDGTYIDPNNEDALRNYVVVSQNIAPNTELRLTFEKDSDGVEYGSLIDTQNIEEIELYVTKLTHIEEANPKPEETPAATPITTTNQSETPVVPAGKFNAEEVLSSLNVTEYSYPGYYYGYLVIENNSNFNIEVFADVKFYNKDNQLIGAKSSSQEAFEKGSKIVLYFSCDEEYTRMEYELSVAEETYYDCVVSNLSYETVSAKEKEIVSVTNNGSKAAKFVKGYILFFKGDRVIGLAQAYFTDNDSEIKPGKTITREIDCYEDYDSVQFFLTGRR